MGVDYVLGENASFSVCPHPRSHFFHGNRAALTRRYGEGSVVILKDEDTHLLNRLKDGYEQDLLDVSATAKYDAAANSGSYTLEVVLLGKVSGARAAGHEASGFVKVC